MSDLTDKIGKLEDQHDKQVDEAIDKGADALDDRTGNKFSKPLDRGVEEAQKRD